MIIRGAAWQSPWRPMFTTFQPHFRPWGGHQRASLGVRNQSCLGTGGLAWGGAPLVCRRSLLYSLCAHVALPVPLQPLPPLHTHSPASSWPRYSWWFSEKRQNWVQRDKWIQNLAIWKGRMILVRATLVTTEHWQKRLCLSTKVWDNKLVCQICFEKWYAEMKLAVPLFGKWSLEEFYVLGRFWWFVELVPFSA